MISTKCPKCGKEMHVYKTDFYVIGCYDIHYICSDCKIVGTIEVRDFIAIFDKFRTKEQLDDARHISYKPKEDL